MNNGLEFRLCHMEVDMHRILVLAPHTDDAEYACGGSINKWIQEGKEVHCVAFSPVGREDLRQEMKCAMGHLGVNHFGIFDFPVREFSKYRQKILDYMIKISKNLQPDLVVLPSTHDTHQDHQVITQEGFRAFKHTSLIGYECIQNNLTFTTNMFVPLSQENIDIKIDALLCYKSQIERTYMQPDFIEALAKVRGVQIGVEYAEVFEVMRWLWA